MPMGRPRISKAYAATIDWRSLTSEQTALYQLALAQARGPDQRQQVAAMLSNEGCIAPILHQPINKSVYQAKFNDLIQRLNTVPGIQVHTQQSDDVYLQNYRINKPYLFPVPTIRKINLGAKKEKLTPTEIRRKLESLSHRPKHYARCFVDLFLNNGKVQSSIIEEHRKRKRIEMLKQQKAFRFLVRRMNTHRIQVERIITKDDEITYELVYGHIGPIKYLDLSLINTREKFHEVKPPKKGETRMKKYVPTRPNDGNLVQIIVEEETGEVEEGKMELDLDALFPRHK